MAPFIKFTEKSQTGSGEKKQLRFVNAAEISSAIYDDTSKTLRFVMVGNPEKVTFELSGEEAADALKVLQKL